MDETQLTLIERIHVLGMGLSLILLTSFFAYKIGFYHLPKALEEKIVSLRHLLGAIFVWLMTQMLLVPLSYLAFLMVYAKWTGQEFESFQQTAAELSENASSWMAIIGIAAAFFGTLLYLFSLPKEVKRSIWGNVYGDEILKNYLIGFSTWVLSFPFVIVVGQLIGIAIALLGIEGEQGEQTAILQLKKTYGSPFLLTAMTVTIVLIVPILEEMIFRGFLQSWLRNFFGVTTAICLTSLVFAGVHYSASQGINNLELLSSLFVLSCFLGYLYERQKTLWAPIGLHSGFNLMSVLMILYQSTIEPV